MARAAPPAHSPARPTRLMTIAALVIAELLLVIAAYQIMANVNCQQSDLEAACHAVRSTAARGLAMIAVMAVYFGLKPKAYRALASQSAIIPGHGGWLAGHAFGLTLVFLPLALFGANGIGSAMAPTLALLTTGGVLTAVSGVLWVTPFQIWRSWMRSDRYVLPLALLFGFLVPDLANLIRPLWEWGALSSLTFFLVFLCLSLWGFDVGVHPPTYEIGIEGFWVQIASQCSGVEGIALTAIFMGFYAALMRPELRQKRFWLILVPLALLASWLFNILRIAILIIVGARVSPEHALNGFHSYAGWLMFTALSLAVVVIAHRAQWLHREPISKHPNSAFRDDPMACLIAPFIVMMLSGVVVSAFWADPEQGYPLRAALMAAALVYFAPVLTQRWQTPSAISVFTGLAVGLLWIVTAPHTTTDTATLTPSVYWVALRLLGTIVLVPIIEELFFRGYVFRRLNHGGLVWTLFALAVSSILFGLLHDRSVAGFAAGIAFALVYMRRGALSDAIGAHVIANATIAIAALLTAKWALI